MALATLHACEAIWSLIKILLRQGGMENISNSTTSFYQSSNTSAGPLEISTPMFSLSDDDDETEYER